MAIRLPPAGPTPPLEPEQGAEAPSSEIRRQPAAPGPSPSTLARNRSPTANRFQHLFASAPPVTQAASAAQQLKSTPQVRGNSTWPVHAHSPRVLISRRRGEAPRFRKSSSAGKTAAPGVLCDDHEEIRSPAGEMYAAYARQAAFRLVDPECEGGRIDATKIDDMLAALSGDASWDEHATQRTHVARTLRRLRDDPELRSAIDSICEDPGKQPRGPARNAIRATLNLPPDIAVGGVHARQAVVMALLGEVHLEPGGGSQAATALAKYVHGHLPLRAVRDWQSLLEGNHMRIRKGNARIQVPINTYARNEKAGVQLTLSADGHLADGTPLERVAGMHAALRALGVPPDTMRDAVASALARLGHAGDGLLTCREIIEEIAVHPSDRPGAAKRVAAAVDAFAGADEVKLLRIWQATLASTAHNGIASRHKDKLRQALVRGASAGSAPHSKSLAGRAAARNEQMTRADQRYKGEAMNRARQEFVAEIDVLIDQRLLLLFDAGEYTYLGTSVLHDQPSGEEPASIRRIENADDFKHVMKQVIKQAARNVGERHADGPDADVVRDGLRFISHSLTGYVGAPGDNEFLDHVCAAFAGNEAAAGLPWKIRNGGDPADLATNYFERPAVVASSAARHAPDPERPGDARHVLEFVAGCMHDMRAEAQAGIAQSADTYAVPVAVGHDVFSLRPGKFADAWSSTRDTAGWTQRALRDPAIRHIEAVRSEPPLAELLFDVVTLACHHHPQAGVPLPDPERLVQLVRQSRPQDGKEYTLREVYLSLTQPGIFAPSVDAGTLRDSVAAALLQAVPPPTIELGDTHRESESKAGSSERLGVLYNPYRDRIELQLMDDAGDGRAPVKGEWLTQPWNIIATPPQDADGVTAIPVR